LGDFEFNKDYDSNLLNQKLKNLFETNFFSDIKFEIIDKTLIINLEENPIIEEVQISGIKNKELTKNLLEQLNLKNRTSFSENLLQSDINLLRNILKINGYYFADINPSFKKNDLLNSIRLDINVNLGQKAKINKISFIGNKIFKDKQLLEIIASEEYKFWKFITNKVYLNQETINLDKRLLENFYKNLGYRNVKILSSFAEYTKKNNFNLIFNIDSGEKFFFNELKLNLPSDYDKSDFNDVEKLFNKIKGNIYSLNDLNLILDEIDKIASLKLYDFINASVDEIIIDNNKLNLTFNVKDSEKFYVERINIFGNYQTIEEVIRNRLIVDEGDPLNNLLFNKSIDKIKSLRIFKDVKTSINNGSDENQKIIDITVQEQPTGEITLAAGVGTSGSTIGGGIREKNFLGKGIDLLTNLEISEDTVKGKFVYSKPNFAYTDNTLSTSLEATTSDFLTDFGYKLTKTGGSIGTEFEQYENLFFSPEISLSIEELSTNTTASNQLKKQEGNYEDVYFNYGINYDLRNSSYKPSSGYNTSFYQELPLVSGKNEIVNTLIFNNYKLLNKQSNMVGKASVYLKSVHSLDSSDVRISKRAQIPERRLRGFQNGKVGPKDGNDYIGGNYVSALNLSTNLPTILNTVENLDFTYFIDLANVWGVDYDKSIDSSNSLRSSTGIGVDFLTPIGPLNFTFSQPITKKASDKTETFRFNIGTTF
jgi:outer membrane protein insertion porin family